MKIIYMYCSQSPSQYQKKQFKKIVIRILSIVIAIAIVNGMPNYAFAMSLDDAINRANSIGKSFWKLLVVIGYWIIAFYGGKDILTEVTQGNTKDVIKIATKYGIGFAVLMGFLQLLDLIKSLS